MPASVSSMPYGPWLLLVEDEENDRALFALAAARNGITTRIVEVADGEDAIALLARLTGPSPGPLLPSVVLLDLKLPRRSGFEVLAWRAAHPDLRRVPFVVLTSSPEPSDLEAASELRANSYLLKPVDLDEFVDLVGIVHAYWVRLNTLAAWS